MSDKAWGGRFEEELDAIAARFSASVEVDGRLWRQDIEGSIAHVRMLADRSILSKDDSDRIVSGLQKIGSSIEAGEFDWDAAKEDVHMNIEAALTEAIGDAGGRLHTARSRNDQVATGLAANELGHVGVLLLRHDRRARGEGIAHLHERKLLTRPKYELLGDSREMNRADREGADCFEQEVSAAHRVE